MDSEHLEKAFYWNEDNCGINTAPRREILWAKNAGEKQSKPKKFRLPSTKESKKSYLRQLSTKHHVGWQGMAAYIKQCRKTEKRCVKE